MDWLVISAWRWSRKHGFGPMIGFVVGVALASILALGSVLSHPSGSDAGGSAEAGLMLASLALFAGGAIGALLGAGVGRLLALARRRTRSPRPSD